MSGKKKKVVWGEGRYTAKISGTYSSFNEFFQKAEKFRLEQERANEYLAKAQPAMLKLLEIRFSNNYPLTVMRPLHYRTSVLKSSMQDELDKSYYRQQAQSDSFVDVVKTINPGTQLLLKGLDTQLREFIFQDAVGVEHCISFDERNLLMTQTDIFEVIEEYFKKESK